jgi:hypothetical protein
MNSESDAFTLLSSTSVNPVRRSVRLDAMRSVSSENHRNEHADENPGYYLAEPTEDNAPVGHIRATEPNDLRPCAGEGADGFSSTAMQIGHAPRTGSARSSEMRSTGSVVPHLTQASCSAVSYAPS